MLIRFYWWFLRKKKWFRCLPEVLIEGFERNLQEFVESCFCCWFLIWNWNWTGVFTSLNSSSSSPVLRDRCWSSPMANSHLEFRRTWFNDEDSHWISENHTKLLNFHWFVLIWDDSDTIRVWVFLVFFEFLWVFDLTDKREKIVTCLWCGTVCMGSSSDLCSECTFYRLPSVLIDQSNHDTCNWACFGSALCNLWPWGLSAKWWTWGLNCK